MEELSVEEKAKRYDEAIGVINKFETDKYGCLLGVKPADIFPELKEGDDELTWLKRFIKEEIDCLRYDIRDYKDSAKLDNLQRALAWLERQSEKGIIGNEREIPNSAWSEEDEKMYNRIYDLIHAAAYVNYDVDEDGKELGGYAKMTNWFKSLKNRVQPKQEWSEEDEKMLDQVIEDIVKLAGPYVCYRKDVDWLKSIKERMKTE